MRAAKKSLVFETLPYFTVPSAFSQDPSGRAFSVERDDAME